MNTQTKISIPTHQVGNEPAGMHYVYIEVDRHPLSRGGDVHVVECVESGCRWSVERKYIVVEGDEE